MTDDGTTNDQECCLVELHEASRIGTSTYRSLDISAPYAIAARMSSSVKSGYSSSNSMTLVPAARKSSINETKILVPLMHGFPKQHWGQQKFFLKARAWFYPHIHYKQCIAHQQQRNHLFDLKYPITANRISFRKSFASEASFTDRTSGFSFLKNSMPCSPPENK